MTPKSKAQKHIKSDASQSDKPDDDTQRTYAAGDAQKSQTDDDGAIQDSADTVAPPSDLPITDIDSNTATATIADFEADSDSDDDDSTTSEKQDVVRLLILIIKYAY